MGYGKSVNGSAFFWFFAENGYARYLRSCFLVSIFVLFSACSASINNPSGTSKNGSGQTPDPPAEDTTNDNTAPIINSLADITINEDSSAGPIAVTVSDDSIEATSLSFSVTSSNTSLLPNGNITVGGSGSNRTLTLTPAANQNGITEVTVTVGDGSNSSAETFSLTVSPVDDPPTITAIANQTVASGGATGALSFTIADIDTAVGSLSVTRASSNTTVIPLGNVVLGGSGANQNVTATSAANQWGSVSITVSVSDGTTSVDEVFSVTVNEPNHASVTFTYPFKNGLRIGESDDQAYTLEGTCTIENLPVRLTIGGLAVSSPPTCTSGTWTLTHDFTSEGDGLINIATTNSTATTTLKVFKDTEYCTPARKAAAPFAGGDGTLWDPFKICTPTQFQQISTDNDAHFEVRNNIDASGFATGEGGITGSINGNNFQVRDFTFNNPASNYVSFLSTSLGAKIYNLHLRNFSISAGAWVGFFNGYSEGGILNNVSATGSLTCASGNCGALYGAASNLIIKNSYVNITSTALVTDRAGLGGSMQNGTRIYRTQAHVESQGRTTFTGGASGNTAISVIESFSTGSITTNQSAGAFVTGIYSGEISDSYTTAAINATSATQDDYFTFAQWTAAEGRFNNLISTGLLTHPDNHTNKGGTSSPGTRSNIYFNSSTTGQSSGNGTPLTAAQFTNQANFTGFDFTNVWSMQSDRPRLKWEDADTVAPTAPTFIFPPIDNYPIGYTDINTIGTYEFEGRCAESEWPVEVISTLTFGGTANESEAQYIPCNLDGFWRFELDISGIDLNHGDPVTLEIRQIDGSGNTSTAEMRRANLYLPAGCTSSRGLVPFAGGTGTSLNPYLICTEAQLDAIQSATTFNQAGVHFALGDSIDMAGAFSVVDLASRTGSFNGNNFRIFNGTVSSSSANTHFISAELSGMNISDLHLFDFTMSSSANYLSPFNFITASNLSFRGSLSGTSYVGGLEASLTSSGLSGGYVRANISGTGSFVGGGIGFSDVNGAAFTNILVRSGIITGGDQVGGLMGGTGNSFSSPLTFSDSQVFASLISATSSGPVGGLIGYGNFGSEGAFVTRCGVTANVISGPTSVGGLIGADNAAGSGTVVASLNSVEAQNIEATAASGVSGGFMGASNVDGNDFSNNRVVAGRIRGRSDTSGFVSSMPGGGNFSHNFSTAFLSTDSGSVYGMRSGGSGDYANTNNFYDSRTAGTSTSVVGTAKAAHEMYRQSTYTGFDFTPGTGVWKMPKNGGYPLLQHQYD